MKAPMRELWDDVMPLGGPCPTPRPGEVARMVNEALDADPSERRRHMRQKMRTAALLAAALLVLTGSVFAAARNWTVLDAFFGGSSEEGEALMNDQPYSVSDDNYTLTVTSSLADEAAAYLTVTVTAKTPEAAEILMADDFENMDTWGVEVPHTEENTVGDVVLASLSTGEEKALRTENSRTWHMELRLGSTPETVSIRLGAMEQDLWLEAPLTLAESVTVAVNAPGTGAGIYDNAAGGPVTLRTVTLSPLGLTLDYTYSEEEARPVPAFLGTDGTVYTWSQLVSDLAKGGLSRPEGEATAVSAKYAFRSVRDLSALEAVVFEGMAYPLDGGAPYAVDVSGLPVPFQLPLVDRIAEGYGFAVPVRALCEGLGGVCTWDNDSRSAVVTFRDVTIVLTEGETTALVDGEAVEMYYAPAIRNGRMSAAPDVFAESWLLDLYAVIADGSVEQADGSAWVIVP